MARQSKIYRPLFSSHNSYEYFSEDDNDNVEGVARQPLDSHQGGDQHDDGHRRQEQRRVIDKEGSYFSTGWHKAVKRHFVFFVVVGGMLKTAIFCLKKIN